RRLRLFAQACSGKRGRQPNAFRSAGYRHGSPIPRATLAETRLRRDGFRYAPCVDRDLAEHAADRIRVADEVDPGYVGTRDGAGPGGPSLRRLDQPVVADQRLQPPAEAGAGDHRVGVDPAAVGEDDRVAVEAVDRGDDLDLSLLDQRHQADVE